MDRRQSSRWKAIRAKRKWRYVFAIAVPPAIFMTVAMPLSGYLIFSDPIKLQSFVIGFSMYLIGGIIFGLILWEASERNK